MISKLFVYILTILLVPFSCATKKVANGSEDNSDVSYEIQEGEAVAYFASGCFWCVEAVYESVKGVSEVVSGYSGGVIKNPTYDKVARGMTEHAEAVKVFYKPDVVSYETLVYVFYGSGDPTTLNQQGPDRGRQYRSAIFYQTEDEKATAERITQELTDEKVFRNPIQTEITKFSAFYDAEEYHQDFERKNPNQGYVRAVSIPRLNRFKAKFPELLK